MEKADTERLFLGHKALFHQERALLPSLLLPVLGFQLQEALGPQGLQRGRSFPASQPFPAPNIAKQN